MIAATAMVSCNSYKTPQFGCNTHWTLEGNHAYSATNGIDIDFGNGSAFPIANSGNGEYDLTFITDAKKFSLYDRACQDYMTSMLKQIPIVIDSIDFFLADRYAVVHYNALTRLKPDMVIQSDSATLVWQANPRESIVQPHDELWRNFVIDKKQSRIAVVDRMVKNGQHLAIIYIMQNARKKLPFAGTMHYDIFDIHNTQATGTAMEWLLGISMKAWKSGY